MTKSDFNYLFDVYREAVIMRPWIVDYTWPQFLYVRACKTNSVRRFY